jgi:formate hydrogenlyase subunit 3/multisubunit Na+/H+ antiporter MnhD subunit
MSLVLLLAVLVPFATVPAIFLSRHRPDVREAASLGGAAVTFLLAAALVPAVLADAPPEATLLEPVPGLALTFRADALGVLFATLASFLWILTTVYSIGYLRARRAHAQTRYFAAFAAVMGATVGVALSANLFSLLVFYEFLTLTTYPLVIHEESEEAYAAGRKYLVYTLSGGGAILAGLAITYSLAGDVTFIAGGNPALAALEEGPLRAVALLLVAGFGVKATIMPLHGWLPDAMVAPTPVSGLLHAVAVVKAGVFGILRTVHFLLGPQATVATGAQAVLLVVAPVTILSASLFALIQDNFKRRLAYSTISQLSYVVLGAALLTPAALLGAAFHLVGHGFAKLTMFFVAGSVAVRTGRERISELDGVGRRMPGTMAAFALATLAMAGLPPMAPFISKWYLSLGAWDADQAVLVLVLAASSVLNIAYFLPILMRAFFAPGEGDRGEGDRTLYGPVLATALGGLLLGLWTALPYGPFEVARALAQGVFP